MTATANQRIGTIFGIVYVVIGLLGFVVTGVSGFAATEGNRLILFEVNPLHNLVHLGIGVALLAAARAGVEASRTMNTLVGSVYLLVGVAGFFLIGSDVNLLALNIPDNLLHLVSAIVLLATGLRREPATGQA